MHQLQDLLNWGGMLMFDSRWKGQEEAVDEFRERHYAVLDAYSNIVRRKRSGVSMHYVLNFKRLKELGAPNVEEFFRGYKNER